MIISDFEFALARRNNQNVAQANQIIDEAGRRIIALQRKLAVAEKALEDKEAENLALRMQIQRLSRRH